MVAIRIPSVVFDSAIHLYATFRPVGAATGPGAADDDDTKESFGRDA
jgi:hypothetical protein